MASGSRPAVAPADILAREGEALADVLEALEAEHQALLARDAARLTEATAAKSRAMAQAAALEAERKAVMALGEMDDETLQPLRQLARRCRDLNEANGALIRGQRRRVEASLSLIRGGQGGVAPATYGPDGIRTARRTPGSLATY